MRYILLLLFNSFLISSDDFEEVLYEWTGLVDYQDPEAEKAYAKLMNICEISSEIKIEVE